MVWQQGSFSSPNQTRAADRPPGHAVQGPQGVVACHGGHFCVQTFQRGAQVAGQNRCGRVGAPQSAAPPEGLLAEGMDVVPTQRCFEKRGIAIQHIQPGQPQQNAYIGRYKDKQLNQSFNQATQPSMKIMTQLIVQNHKAIRKRPV